MATSEELRLRAQARRRRAEAEAQRSRTQEPSGFDRFARGFGNVVADTLGLPVGAARELGNLTGLTDFEDVSGANYMRGVMEPLGLSNAPGEGPQGVAGHAGQAAAISGTLGAGLMGAAGRAAAPAVETGVQGVTSLMRGELPSTTRRVIEVLGRPAVTRPGTVGSAEFAAGAGAGAAAAAAGEEYGEHTWQQALAELTGGIASGAGTATAGTAAIRGLRAGKDLAGNTLIGQGVAAAGRLLGYQSPSAGTPRASRRLGDVSSHPGDARRSLEGTGPDEVDADLLTVPQQTGDTGIMRLGARSRMADEESTRLDQWREGAERATSEIIRRIDSATDAAGADPNAPVAALRQYKEQALTAADDMVTAATAAAARAVDDLAPGAPPEEASRLVRRELESALGNVRALESRLWEENPYRQTVVTANHLNDTYGRMLDEAGDDVMGTLPPSVRRFLGNVEEPEAPTQFLDHRGQPIPTETPPPPTREATFGELQVMRSELLRDARQYRRGAAPDYNRARIFESLADSITDDFMDATSGLPLEGQQFFNAARQLTARKNEIFRQGAVGQVLRTGPDSGPAVAPEMTLRQIFGHGARELRGVGVRQLEAAVEDNPRVWGAVDDYMRHQFNTKVIRDGEVNQAAASRFFEDNAGLLAARQELRDQMDEAVQTGQRLQSARQSTSDLARELNDPLVNRSEIFLRAAGEESVDLAARRVLNSANSRESVRDVLAITNRDRTGEATRGFKKAVSDEIIQGAIIRGDGQRTPGQYLDGQRLRQIFAGPDASPDGVPADILRVRRAVNELYSPDELRRLRRLANTAARIQQDVGAQRQPAQRLMDDATGQLLDFSSRVLGAKVGGAAGRAIGGGNIQSPGAGANWFQRMVARGVSDPARKLLIDAIDGKTVKSGDRNVPVMDLLLKGYTRQPLSRAEENSLAAYIESIGPDLSGPLGGSGGGPREEGQREPVTIDIRGDRQ